MIQNFISMNGYGLFVWLSFAITFLACAIIYYKTYKTLKKYEKDFAKELDQLSESERKLVLAKSKVASQVLASYNKSI
jgi:heme exporter protein CcmD